MSIHQTSLLADDAAHAAIVATIVPDPQRLAFLPKHFGAKHVLRAEATVYGFMQRLTANAYSGGYWHFIELSNGGFYLRLNTSRPTFRVKAEGNFFDGEMSADAASITACLYAINLLLWQGLEHLEDRYYRLREYASEHVESALILAAID